MDITLNDQCVDKPLRPDILANIKRFLLSEELPVFSAIAYKLFGLFSLWTADPNLAMLATVYLVGDSGIQVLAQQRRTRLTRSIKQLIEDRDRDTAFWQSADPQLQMDFKELIDRCIKERYELKLRYFNELMDRRLYGTINGNLFAKYLSWIDNLDLLTLQAIKA